MEIEITIRDEDGITLLRTTAPTVDMAIEKLGAWERSQKRV